MGMGMGDQSFIVMMIPHHEGAIAMADQVRLRARHPEIRALAERIRTSQSTEIATMRTWYRQWFGATPPAGPRGPAMGGMAGAGSLAALDNAADIDRAFLEQMIPHHRMGVRMAAMAQINAAHPELRALEQAMVRVQSDEIQQMAQWYRSWYPSSPPP